MGRPRAFDTDQALDAAKDAFWGRGYEATSLAVLEASTGLSRSSLYQAFGGKRELFDAVLARYQAQHIDPVLRDLERPGAGLAELRAYLALVAATLRTDPRLAQRGCLIVNTMTELASHDEEALAMAVGYRERIVAALANALRGAARDEQQRRQVPRQARLLATTVIGILVTAHLDPENAAGLCDDLRRSLTNG